MNEDRTESDWQGLVSEVRPRRRPGGMGPRPQPPVPAPGRRARQGRAGDARAEAGALRPRPPTLLRQVRRCARTSRSTRAPLSSTPAGASLWGGPSLRQGVAGLPRDARGSGRGSQAPPAFPATAVLEAGDWMPSSEAERWCQGEIRALR